jgi:hypothetical protein
VLLASDNVSYDGSQVFQADVTVQNLIAQVLGTTDGSTLDPDGVRVFFHSGPTVTMGAGTVTVSNATGTGTFTGTDQPYFQYDEMLATGVTSAPLEWQWNVPPTVTTFEFAVYVTAEVEHPDGWVAATPDAIVVPTGTTQQLTTRVLDVVGREQLAAEKTYATSDPSVVAVSQAGLITAGSEGTAQVTVTSPPRTPATVTVVVTSNGVTRQWIGGDVAGPSAWELAANWYPAGTPATLDTVVVPTGAANMPVLAAGTGVGRVEVEDQATLSLGGHTMTIWLDVETTGGQVLGPGLLTFAGTAGKLAGSVPSVLVTGSIDLVGEVTVLGDLTVRGGSLSDRGFLLRLRAAAP